MELQKLTYIQSPTNQFFCRRLRLLYLGPQTLIFNQFLIGASLYNHYQLQFYQSQSSFIHPLNEKLLLTIGSRNFGNLRISWKNLQCSNRNSSVSWLDHQLLILNWFFVWTQSKFLFLQRRTTNRLFPGYALGTMLLLLLPCNVHSFRTRLGCLWGCSTLFQAYSCFLSNQVSFCLQCEVILRVP